MVSCLGVCQVPPKPIIVSLWGRNPTHSHAVDGLYDVGIHFPCEMAKSSKNLSGTPGPPTKLWIPCIQLAA